MTRDPFSQWIYDQGTDLKDSVTGYFREEVEEAAEDIADSAIEFMGKSMFAGTMFLGSLPEWFAQSVVHLVAPITDPWLNPFFPTDSRAETVVPWNWTTTTMGNDWAVLAFERLSDPFDMGGSGHYTESVFEAFELSGVTGTIEIAVPWSWEFA